jgi:hypothetical protein
MQNNYLSEFEQAFEMDKLANSAATLHENDEVDSEYNYEYLNEQAMDEFEQDEFDNEENEFEDEFELDNEENELDNEENEFEDEFEINHMPSNYDENFDPRDSEFEHRLYHALSSNADNELQTELEIDNILHEMEQDYFFGANSWLRKKAMKYGKYAIPGYAAMKSASALGRLNIRNLLKNKLLQTAANFIPGAGPVISKAMGIAGNIMDKVEMGKRKIEDTVKLAKDAYQNLANTIPDAQSELELNRASKQAWQNALQNQQIRNTSKNWSAPSASKFNRSMSNTNYANRKRRIVSIPPNARVAVFPNKISINRRQQVIPIKLNSIVVVKSGQLIIWETN